jgi:hypothetical protein
VILLRSTEESGYIKPAEKKRSTSPQTVRANDVARSGMGLSGRRAFLDKKRLSSLSKSLSLGDYRAVIFLAVLTLSFSVS